MQVLRLIFSLFAAGALAVLLYYLFTWLLAWQRGARRALADFQQTHSTKDGSTQAKMGSKAYKIKLAFSTYRLDVSGWEESALLLAYALVAGAILLPLALLKLPTLLWLSAPALSFFLVNGYLLGREFFEFAAMRHRPEAEAKMFRRKHSTTIFLAGLVIAAFLAVPVVNLATPLFAAAMMVHLHKMLSAADPGFASAEARRKTAA